MIPHHHSVHTSIGLRPHQSAWRPCEQTGRMVLVVWLRGLVKGPSCEFVSPGWVTLLDISASGPQGAFKILCSPELELKWPVLKSRPVEPPISWDPPAAFVGVGQVWPLGPAPGACGVGVQGSLPSSAHLLSLILPGPHSHRLGETGRNGSLQVVVTLGRWVIS